MGPTVHELTHRSFQLATPLALSCALLGVFPQELSFGAETTPATPTLSSRVDAAVNAILTRTGLPSASIALVRNSDIIYAQAYGLAQLTPQRAATPAMRYAVGSISKEFIVFAARMGDIEDFEQTLMD